MSERKKEETGATGQNMFEQQTEAKTVRKIVLIVSAVLTTLFILIVGGGYFYIQSALKPVASESEKQEKKITIPIGSSVSGIGEILEEKGIIKNAKIFKYYVKFKNESGFMAGEYKLSTDMTMAEIVDSLKTGKVAKEVVLKITIPEGKQLKQIAEIIAEKTGQQQETILAKLDDEAFIQSFMEKYPEVLTDEILADNILHPLEGYLFPATYDFYEENPSLENIVSEMLKKTQAVLEEYSGVMAEQNLSPHKLLTMASLIEEEATEKADREGIASVFYNRIEAGMPLQTDPTVLYAHGKHKDRVFYKDLEIDSPYNTYKYKGLPPGPIANAGTMSIDAALNPKDTDYLYFLATPAGEVVFNRTLAEHNADKAKYITAQN